MQVFLFKIIYNITIPVACYIWLEQNMFQKHILLACTQ